MTETKTVPVEPTREMIEAACVRGPDTNAGQFSYEDAWLVWSAMLSAAPSPQVGREEGDGWQDISTASEVTLAECSPGLFTFNGRLGFKTEYGAMSGKPNADGTVLWTVTSAPDAYVVESGERFWGGAKTREEMAVLLVRPLPPPPFLINGGK